MLTPEEEKFIAWWEQNGEKQKTSLRPVMTGASAGFVMGICLVIMLTSNWDKRATMVANSKLSSAVLVFAIVLISAVMGFLYRKFRWEMQDQRFLELKARKNAYLRKQKQP